jgi:hypothetical protein
MCVSLTHHNVVTGSKLSVCPAVCLLFMNFLVLALHCFMCIFSPYSNRWKRFQHMECEGINEAACIFNAWFIFSYNITCGFVTAVYTFTPVLAFSFPYLCTAY